MRTKRMTKKTAEQVKTINYHVAGRGVSAGGGSHGTQLPLFDLEPMFACPACGLQWNEVELINVRECSREDCGTVFDGSDGRACLDCGSPFTRNLTSRGCPACADESECSPVPAQPEAGTDGCGRDHEVDQPRRLAKKADPAWPRRR